MHWIIAINVGCAAALCLITAWAIVTPKIHEGPMIKIGLVLLDLGLFGVSALLPTLADQPSLLPLMHALLLGNVGVVVTAGGLAWRIWRRPDVRAAAVAITGWPPLHDDRPPDPLAR